MRITQAIFYIPNQEMQIFTLGENTGLFHKYNKVVEIREDIEDVHIFYEDGTCNIFKNIPCRLYKAK